MAARTSISCDPCRQADPSEGWDMVVLRRIGGPPLRFAGRALCASRDRDLSVRIWQAKTGGFVLAHSVETPGAEAASRHAMAEEVMVALERYCRDVEEAADMKLDLRSTGRLHLADLLEDLARLSDWRRRFRVLAGETLDAFETQLRAADPQHSGGIE